MPKYLLAKKKGAKKWQKVLKAKGKGTAKELRLSREKVRRRTPVKIQTRIVSEKTAKKLIGKKKPTRGTKGRHWSL